MARKIWEHIKRIDFFLDSHTGLLILLVLVVLLRIPNFSDPYWYGDEAIYLTIGQALNRGVELYSEIIDHKTPLIYVFARVGTQLNFRLLMLGWMLVSTVGFYILNFKLLKSKMPSVLATLAFVLFTTLPTFEGHIPNGELFVMGFMIWGGVILTNTHFFKSFMDKDYASSANSREMLGYILAGTLFGLGILTKVPAVFDLAAFMAIGFFAFTNALGFASSGRLMLRCKRLFLAICLIGVGTAIPILISIFWFVVRGSGQAYLDFGLLYNFRYSGSWELPFSSPILHFLFSLPGKILLVSIVGVTLTLARKIISPATQFGVLWFFLSLVAATLSNRPYPHYYLQSLVPLALIIGIGIDSVGKLYSKKASKIQGNLWAQIGIAPLVLVFFVTVLVLLNVSKYPTISYYQQWWQLVQGTKSPEEFRNGFNHLMADNYAVATKITSSGEEKLFIWGTNPMLYALTNTTPTGRFTVSFHIADFDAYDETLSDLKEDNPRYIVVMKDEQHEFNGFSAYLNRNYFVDTTYDNFTLWRRQPFKL